MNAYLNILGLETLGIRMKALCNNALAPPSPPKCSSTSVLYGLLSNPGIIVLLVLNKDLKNKEEIKGSLAKYSKYIKHWEEGEKGDVDSTVQTIRKLTEYAEDVYGVASHI